MKMDCKVTTRVWNGQSQYRTSYISSTSFLSKLTMAQGAFKLDRSVYLEYKWFLCVIVFDLQPSSSFWLLGNGSPQATTS